MITLNGNRTKPTINDVLAELDAFEAETMTTAKPFTAFILDVDREENDPRVVHFETTSGAMMHGDIETAYFYDRDAGEAVDPEEAADLGFSFGGGANDIGDYWQYKGAAVLGVIAGHHDAVWTPDGMANADYDAAFDLAKKAEEKAAAADPFKETYRSAWVSTVHLRGDTLNFLNMLAPDDLPFWILPTECGWVMRFDAMDVWMEAFGEYRKDAENADKLSHIISHNPDVVAIAAMLKAHGYQAAHLDADGPEIEGLETFGHDHL